MIKYFIFLKKLQPTVSTSSKRSVAYLPRPHIRRVAWGTLLLQLFIPLSASFSPAIAAMKASKAATTLSYSSSEPYVLGLGETVDTVAKKYGISVDELKKINIYRTFSRPFTTLTTGDEIDVPRKASPFSIDNNKGNILSVENQLAGHAVAGATALSNGDPAKSGERVLRSAASNEFNSSAQQWLSQFGTARVQLNVNDDFHLDGSAADVLMPLYDNEKSILFTQLGARNKDSRNTVNIGAGVRTFQGSWMYGANTFFDNDLTGKNRRIGVGAEAWTDYLKLSANNYFGITDWHQSRDFTDYNERPANGYDLRAEAYLPSYPQLGGKVMYEKYVGDEVALFGKDNRQKNPHAITAGINYTPIPLVTIGAEHRAGKSGQNDSSINVQLNYRLGETWQSHIAPSAVATSRTLAGSRYDLVERNNNIVLDYQKQNLVRLSLPESLVGDPLSLHSITAQVTATHGLKRIDWQSAELIAAGGVLKQTSKDGLEITLPGYQVNRASGNSYILNAIAYDNQGNASPQASMLITVNAPTINYANSTLVAAPVNIEANGSDTSLVTLTLRDNNNNPVTGQAVALATTLGTLGTVTEQASGVYTATLTAGTLAGTASLTASVGGTALGVAPATVTLNGNSSDLSTTNSTLVATPVNIEANGSDTSLVTLTLRDNNNNPVTGQAVALATTLGTLGTVTEQASGVYTATLTAGTLAGTASLTASVGGTALGVAPATVTLNGNSSDLSTTNSTLVATPVNIEANGSDTSLVTLTLRDNNNNPVTGQAVALATTLGTLGTVTEQASGVYTATLTAGTLAGTASLTASVGGTALGVAPATVTLNGNSSDLSTTNSTLVATPVNIEANGSDTSLVTLTLRDNNNNPVTGQAVALATTLGTLGTVTEQASGVYTATLTAGTLAGTASLTASVGGTALGVAPATVTLNGNSSDLSTTNSTLVATPVNIEANGSDTSLVTLTLRDNNNNPVTGQAVALATTLGTLGTVTEQASGVYTATLTAGTLAGTASLTASVGGTALGVAPATVTLNGNSSDLSTTNSTLVATPVNIEANGSDTSLVTLTLRDNNNNPVTGQAVALATTLGTLGTVTEQASGVYTATLTAGTLAGTASLTASVGGTALGVAPATVTLNGNSSDLSTTNSTLVATPVNIEANGSDTSLVTLTLRDNNNNPVTGQAVALATTLGTLGTVTEQASGVYTATLTAGTLAGTASLTASVGGTALGVAPATVTLNGNSSDLSTTNSTLVATPVNIEANGSDTSLVTLTLRDNNNNPVTGQAVALATTLGTLGTVTEQASGVYTATLTAGTLAGTASLTASVGGTALGVAPATVTLNGNSSDLSTTNSTLVATPVNIEANGSDTSLVTLTLRDNNNNPVTGQAVALATTLGTLGTVTEQASGVYTATLTAGTLAGTASLTASVGGTALGVAPATVTLNGNSSDLSTTNSTLVAAPVNIEANGSDTSLVTLTLRDNNDNPVTGQAVALATTLGTLGTVTEQASGVYTATLTAGTLAGTASLTASVGGTALGVAPATVTLNGNSSDLSTTNSTLVAAPVNIEANGSDTSLVTLTLRDNNDNPVTGQAVALATTLGTLGTVTEQASGVYTATLTAGTLAGTASLTASVGGTALGVAPATVTLNGNSSDLSTTNSTLVAAPVNIEANGSDTSLVTLTLRDNNDNPVTGQAVALATTLGTLGTVTEQASGVYTATLTAGTLAGTASLTASVGGTALGVAPATVTLNGNSSDLSTTNSTLVAAPVNIEANGSDTSLVTLTLRDNNDNPVTGQAVALATTLGTLGTVTEQASGVYTATLTAGTLAGTASLTASVGGTALGVAPATVTLNGNSSDLSTTNSTLVATPVNIEANGSDTSLVTLTLRDNNNNPVTGQAVALATTLGTLGTVTEQASGVYTATLTAGTLAGTASLTASVGGTALGVAPATVTLNGNSSDLSTTNSTLVATPVNIEANGSDTSLVTLTLRDNNNNPVTGQAVALATTLGTLGTVTEQASGVYTATLTAGTLAGTASLTASVGGTALGVAPATVTLNGNSSDLSTTNSTLVATPVNIEANGSDTSLVTLTLRDNNNNPVTGQAVALATTLGTLGTVTEQASGVYTATLTAGTLAGTASLTASVGGTALGVAPATVTLNGNSSDLSTTNSTLVATPVNIEANGSDTSLVTLTLRDNNNNPVTGQAVALATTLGTLGTVTEQASGVYTATLTAGTLAGTASLTASVGGTALGVAPATVTLNGNSSDLSTTNSTLVATPVNIEANGSDTSLVTLTLRDNNNNPVTGQAVALATTLGTLGTVTEQASGVYTATLTAGTLAGTASLTASVGGTALGVAPATVTLNGNSSDLSTTNSTLVATPVNIEANGSDTSLVTLTLRDNNNNPVTGQAVALATTLGTLGTVTEQASGVYTATLTAGTLAGTASLTASVGGTALGVAPATVTLNGNSSDLSTTNSTLVATPVNIEANGSDTSLVTLTLRDNNNNPVTGQAVALATTLGTLGTVTEQASGVYTATLTAGTLAGTASLTASVGGTALGVAPATVTLNGNSSDLSTTNSTLVAAPVNIEANGSDTSLVTLTLRDNNDNPVTGQAVALATTLGTLGTVTEQASGVYTATLTAGTLAGTASLTASVGGSALGVNAASIVLMPIPVDLTMSVDSDRKNIGDTIQLTISAKLKNTSDPAPNTKITFTSVDVTNRQNAVVTNSGALKINGIDYDLYTGVTNSAGELVLSITDPNGIGVKTTLQAVAESNDRQQIGVIFNIVTSPDTPLANMWGYMTETLTYSGVTFTRPYLAAERTGVDVASVNNESWATFTQNQAVLLCTTLPTRAQLVGLYNLYPNSTIQTLQGWPLNTVYRTSELSSPSNGHFYVYMNNGTVSYNPGGGDTNGYNVSCIH
ncbi:YrIlm family inverse autotransporter adhesin [Yersinia sp. SCPM-O-B-9106 (C-191)]|nr:YrIlm family inverse autotransporter adhesin [Yersinia sp. SCPM-O-B-9106 (C-191)]UZM75457.1 YrIlm family inverse autotransporter adhesin [Yersinia sp. SCPM-O-B-9106 (C-191)]